MMMCPFSESAEEVNWLQILSTTVAAWSPGTRCSSVSIPYKSPSLSVNTLYINSVIGHLGYCKYRLVVLNAHGTTLDNLSVPQCIIMVLYDSYIITL